MAQLPPPPTNDQTGSFAWLEWFRQLRNYISTTGSVPWNIINFAGSNITSIASRSHQNLQSLQGGTTGQYYHLTNTEYTGTGTGAFVKATGATVGGTWIAGSTWTLPAWTAGGDISGGNYKLDNIKIGSITPNTIVGTTVKASTAAGFISSDGSTGFTGTVTTASLVGKTITIKDGIITGFA